jgi:putative transposase
MPNHYHFLFRQDGDTPLSKLVGVLFNAYVQAVNRQQGRTGTLFEDRFKHIQVDKETYLLQLCRYIHANPVNAGLVTSPDEWPYSNYGEWIQTREGSLVDHALVDEYFPDRAIYQEFVIAYVLGIDMLPEGIGDYLLEEK